MWETLRFLPSGFVSARELGPQSCAILVQKNVIENGEFARRIRPVGFSLSEKAADLWIWSLLTVNSTLIDNRIVLTGA